MGCDSRGALLLNHSPLHCTTPQGAPARKPVSERTQGAYQQPMVCTPASCPPSSCNATASHTTHAEGGAPLSQPPAQAAAPAQAQRGASVFNRLGAGSAGSSIAAGRTGGAAAGGGSTNVSQRLSRQSVLAALEAKRGRGGAVRGRRSSSGVQVRRACLCGCTLLHPCQRRCCISHYAVQLA